MRRCNTNPVIKIIRILFSLAVIVLGIVYGTWLGALGLITLISAFTGTCPIQYDFRRRAGGSERNC